jgi:hypothetical protein
MEEIKVGDAVLTANPAIPGKVLAIHGDRAWVLLDSSTATIALSRLRKVPEFTPGDVVTVVVGVWAQAVLELDGVLCSIDERTCAVRITFPRSALKDTK